MYRHDSLRSLVALTIIAAFPTLCTTARADEGFQLDPIETLPSQGTALLDLGTSRLLDHGLFSFGFFSSYQHAPLTAVVAGERDTVLARLVSHRVTTEAHVALGLFGLMEFGLVVPAVAYQSGDSFAALGAPDRRVGSSAFGDIRLTARGRFFGPTEGQNGVGLHLTVPIAFPTGDKLAFTSDGSVRIRPMLGTDLRLGAVRVGINAGYEFRPRRTVAAYVSNDLVHWGAWLSLEAVPQKLEISVIGRGFVTTSTRAPSGAIGAGRTATFELLTTLNFRVDDWLLQFGGGTALVRGVGTPDGRAFFGVAFAPGPRLDTDGDGVPDDVDKCFLSPEDRDGFEDDDGCPDPDNDQDRIPDSRDRCPNEPETYNGYEDEDGCPERDSDGDGVADLFDRCKNDPEDRDGFEDEDGCPDPDNDHDGILDAVDSCPNEAEDPDGFEDGDGCPDPDNDGDGILDANDLCPNEPENINGINDNDGCPEADKDLDGIVDDKDECPDLPESMNSWRDVDGCPDTRNPFIHSFLFEIRTTKPIFFSFDNERPLPDAKRLIAAIASVMKENPWITKLRIEGHTDSEGQEDFNLAVSEQRAAVVRDALVKRGIEERRLVSMGLGEQFPTADNASPMGRIRNRRIEFHIVEMHGVPVPEKPRKKPPTQTGAP